MEIFKLIFKNPKEMCSAVLKKKKLSCQERLICIIWRTYSPPSTCVVVFIWATSGVRFFIFLSHLTPAGNCCVVRRNEGYIGFLSGFYNIVT